jgi:tetratricopeptide (TPR) repeat protein
MDSEIDSLYAEVEHLLDGETVTDDRDLKRLLVRDAISKAQQLIRRCTNDADFFHLLGLAWYHHPDKSKERSAAIRDAWRRALDIDPHHQFANQYLGYINFDEADYETALKHFRNTDHEFFISIHQKWRSLKAIELAFVCELRLGRAVDLAALQDFFDDYQTEERADVPNTVVTLELRRCAEWLFEQSGDLNEAPLKAIVAFLDAVGDLARSDHSEFKAACSRRPSD